MSAIRFEGDSLSNLTETRNATNEVAVQYQGLLSPINKPQLSYLYSYCLLIACASTSSADVANAGGRCNIRVHDNYND